MKRKQLLGQDELAQFGGLQSVAGAVVLNDHGLVAAQQCVAAQTCLRSRAATLVTMVVHLERLGRRSTVARRRKGGVHGGHKINRMP